MVEARPRRLDEAYDSRLRALGWTALIGQRQIVAEYLSWAARRPGLRDTFAEARTSMEVAGVLPS